MVDAWKRDWVWVGDDGEQRAPLDMGDYGQEGSLIGAVIYG